MLEKYLESKNITDEFLFVLVSHQIQSTSQPSLEQYQQKNDHEKTEDEKINRSIGLNMLKMNSLYLRRAMYMQEITKLETKDAKCCREETGNN